MGMKLDSDVPRSVFIVRRFTPHTPVILFVLVVTASPIVPKMVAP